VIVRKLSDVLETPREVVTPNWRSRRLLLADDGMGFSLHDTVIQPDTETEMEYKHHLEAVYCIEGDGEVITLSDGKRHPISAGTVYALDAHDRHLLRARTTMRMVCVFNPPCTGEEVHGEDGAYPPSGKAA
jgi:L-ectoine synthase